MNRLQVRLATFLFVCFSISPKSAQAQEMDQRFHDLFVTAGYCTAFGAAVGTAFLAWSEDPSEDLQYVAMGASLGFLGGSILGAYVIFSPTLVQNDANTGGTLLSSAPMPSNRVVLRPHWNAEKQRISAIESGFTLATF